MLRAACFFRRYRFIHKRLDAHSEIKHLGRCRPCDNGRNRSLVVILLANHGRSLPHRVL